MASVTLHTAMNIFALLSEVDKIEFKSLLEQEDILPSNKKKEDVYTVVGEQYRPENIEALVHLITH